MLTCSTLLSGFRYSSSIQDAAVIHNVFGESEHNRNGLVLYSNTFGPPIRVLVLPYENSNQHNKLDLLIPRNL